MRECLSSHRLIPILKVLWALTAWFAQAAAAADLQARELADLSPTALALSMDGKTLYVACATGNNVLLLDTNPLRVRSEWELPDSPSGLALARNDAFLVVTCASPESEILILDAVAGKVQKRFTAGHTALSPVLVNNEELLVCNRFDHAVCSLNLASGREMGRIKVAREPVSLDVTGVDNRFVLVSNHLPNGRSDVAYVAATVSVIDRQLDRVVKELRLPNGSINLRQICVSPDAKYACVAQTIGRFQVPVTQLARGWVNTSAITLIDLKTFEVPNSILLDDVDRGAANPWGTAWSPDGRWLCVTHAGTHELSIIDFPRLLKKLASLAFTTSSDSPESKKSSSICTADVPNDLTFLHGLRRRVRLSGNGPRALVLSNERAYVAGYFSDTIEVVNLDTATVVDSLALSPGHELSRLRRGEIYFNDATLCFQGWQSCASCHDDDARVDGLNWDLLNDGIGNPKDTKSLLLSHRTPPVMSLGVRANASIAVRTGIQNSLASELSRDVPESMDAWLESLVPAPSPRLVHGRLSETARKGQVIFHDAEVGCADCHAGELFTDLRSYDVGTQNAFDKGAAEFDTPTLRELWRTAPYLHDGSAATLRDVLATRNPTEQHGKTSHLSSEELDQLIEYLLSL